MAGGSEARSGTSSALSGVTDVDTALPRALFEAIAESSAVPFIVIRGVRKKAFGAIDRFESLMASRGARAIIGHAEASGPGHDLAETFPSIHDNLLFSAIAGVVERGETLDVCWFDIASRRWFGLKVRGVDRDIGIILLHDCSEKVSFLQRMNQKDRFYSAICSSVPFGILHLDCSELAENSVHVTNINAAARLLFNVDPACTPLNDCQVELRDLLPSSVYMDLVLQIASNLDQRVAVNSEVLLESGSGGGRYLEFIFTPIFIDSETPEIVLCLVFDQTEKRNAESFASQAQRLQALGQLTGGIAHDFNNRLTVITGNLELLERRIGSDPENLKLLHEAVSSAFSSSLLTQHLLAFSRRQSLRPTKIDVNENIGNIVTMLGRSIGEHITIETDFADELWPVSVDVAYFETAIVNFALNSRDAMPHGGVLTIATRNLWLTQQEADKFGELEPGPYVSVQVSDNGQGISPEILSRVMEPFFTTKEAGKGTGLGLSSAYGFARQSHGGLQITSEIGKGTTVTLVLPKYRAGAGVLSPELVQHEGSEDLPLGQGESILVVEDDPQLRKLVCTMLEQLVYNVLEAKDGACALSILAERPDAIDVALVDNVMPGGMSGVELADRIRRLYPGVRVILTTGYASLLNERIDRVPPGTPLLEKPYKLASLAGLLRQVCEYGSSGSDASVHPG